MMCCWFHEKLLIRMWGELQTIDAMCKEVGVRHDVMRLWIDDAMDKGLITDRASAMRAKAVRYGIASDAMRTRLAQEREQEKADKAMSLTLAEIIEIKAARRAEKTWRWVRARFDINTQERYRDAWNVYQGALA